jgi:hypothetical protein
MKVAGSLFAVVATVALLHAEDIRLLNGREYRNVKVLRAEPDGIVFSTAVGVLKIPIDELCDADKSKFSNSPITVPASVVPQRSAERERGSASRASDGFVVTLSQGLGVGSLEYKSANELEQKAKRVAEGLMLADAETKARISAVPKGGQLIVIIHGSNVYSAMTKNYTVIILDEHNQELLRKVGDDSVPKPSVHHWIGAMVIDLPKPFGDSLTVYIVNNDSGHREEYRITRS